ncbi:hypothetical protein V1477_016810 [Vespula maculifrons]|uniref:Uncharacterized protein n=2 Tax=Vespula TaxID=7451 RepID=A0A834N9M0_VESVU|nr:hypothetical protein HZH66_006109 [Vespula vulgaris]
MNTSLSPSCYASEELCNSNKKETVRNFENRKSKLLITGRDSDDDASGGDGNGGGGRIWFSKNRQTEERSMGGIERTILPRNFDTPFSSCSS